jgi:hypothetical protein
MTTRSADDDAALWDDSWMQGDVMMSYDDVKERFELRSARIAYTGVYVREKPDRCYVFPETLLCSAYRHLKYTVLDRVKDVVEKRPFIKRWLQDEHIRLYDHMNVVPPPLTCDASTYNLWRGFSAAKYKVPVDRPVDVESDGVKAFVHHWNVLLGHDVVSVDYVLDWMAQIVQQPGVKPGIALLLKGDEGCGKNRATDLFKLVLGADKCLETAKPANDLYGRFTSQREGKFLIVVNEANDLLKDMITSETFVSEAKGVNAYTVNCYARFIFTTNNENCLRVNPDSRRYVVFEVSAALKGDTAYFKRLSAFIADEHARYEFYTFLLARNIADRDWINDRPITAMTPSNSVGVRRQRDVPGRERRRRSPMMNRGGHHWGLLYSYGHAGPRGALGRGG